MLESLDDRAQSTAPRARRCRREAVAGRPVARRPRRGARRDRRARAARSRMRVGQLWHWLYVRGATDFARDDQRLQGAPRRRSPAPSPSTRPEIVTEQVSEDGTRKWLLRFPPRGAGRPVEIETVYIPEEGRGTLCLSSQVGCTLSCTLLPHRHAEAGAQPDLRGDRRPDPARPRPARRPSRPRRRTRRRGAGDRPARLQRRHDGDGRAALQFRQRQGGAARSPPTATASACRSGASRSRPPASCR